MPGFPAAAASRIAVIGRIRLYLYLADQAARLASAIAICIRAKSPPLSARESLCCLDAACATSPQICVGLSVQKIAMTVCAAVRFVLSADPSSRTSLISLAYSALVIARGPGN